MQRRTSHFLQTAVFTYLTACWRLIAGKNIREGGKTNTWLLHPEEYITARVLKPQYAKHKITLIFTGSQNNAQTYGRAHYASLHKQVNEEGEQVASPLHIVLSSHISKLCLYKDSLASEMFPLQVLLLLLQK